MLGDRTRIRGDRGDGRDDIDRVTLAGIVVEQAVGRGVQLGRERFDLASQEQRILAEAQNRVGSLLAGRWSGDKVEFGLVPLGAVGLGVFSDAAADAAISRTIRVTASRAGTRCGW